MFKKIFFYTLLSITLFFSIFSIVLYHRQENILFMGKPLSHSHKFDFEHDIEEMFFNTPDHATIHALHFKVDNPKGVVLYFHGRGGNLDRWKKTFYDFLSRDYEVIAMDYRTFGKSKGELSETSLFQDAEIIYDYAVQHFDEHHIVIYGRSLGTGIATYVASKHPSRLLILESPYFSILDQAAHSYPYIPRILLNLIVRYPLRTDEKIPLVNSPVEFFHGTSDELIPYESSTRLIDLIKKSHKVKLTPIFGGKHNDLSKYEAYQKRLDEILK